MGVALIPRLAAQIEIERKQLMGLVVREMKFERRLHLIYRRGATLSAKRVELLNEIVPGLTDIALLVNPRATLAESQISDTKAAVEKTGQRLHVLNASSASEV